MYGFSENIDTFRRCVDQVSISTMEQIHMRTQKENIPIGGFSSIVDCWDSMADLSRDLRVSPQLVRTWKLRNYIPDQYWFALIFLAKRRNIEGVTGDHLIHLAARKLDLVQ